MKNLKRLLVCGIAGVSVVAQADLLNGDFSSGLTGWTTGGTVVATAQQESDITDGSADHAYLYQGLNAGVGAFSIDFDFTTNSLSGSPFDGTLDVFFASVYFITNMASFNLDTLTFDDATGLLDMNDNGISLSVGTLSVSPKGDGWSHFSATLTNQFANIIPVFELFDQNLNGSTRVNDSFELIDNVSMTITPVPEASSFFCLIVGAMVVLVKKQKILFPSI